MQSTNPSAPQVPQDQQTPPPAAAPAVAAPPALVESTLDPKYRNYFNIDPEYLPQVNEQVIKANPDLWKKFYPHETFVRLIKDTISVLTKKQKVSIWVEGAYGTGKSHAVLTLKKLLDADEATTREYFERYPDQLDRDLFNKFMQAKSGDKILTVHRYGSSSIRNDDNLVFAMQESIVAALKENGLRSTTASLRDTVLKWLSGANEREYFNSLLHGEYTALFGGDDVDAVVRKLKEYADDQLTPLIDKIARVGEEKGINTLRTDTNGFCDWVKSVIAENHLKAIVFIWDEFTEYFRNNLKALTGFQQIAELSSSSSFYLIIVTHKSSALFSDTDHDKKRILNRFINPTCQIALPENMAFRLMGAALQKTDDPRFRAEWDALVKTLYDRTHDSRSLVMQKAKISEKELKDVLPLHPYAALLLKYISSAFDANQRSMFDFIKNDRGDDIKGFQWFIDNYGPYDDNPLLTVDMLWDFFYEKGKENLSTDIRQILDYYHIARSNLRDDEKRVLKAVLLLQAISQRAGDAVDLFIPDAKNLNNAFEGTDLTLSKASNIADKLCRDHILFEKPLGNSRTQYAVLANAGDAAEIARLKDKYLAKSTGSLIEQGALTDLVPFTGALASRYLVEYASATDVERKAKALRSRTEDSPYRLGAVVVLAKNDEEVRSISISIDPLVADKAYRNVVFIDATDKPLGIARLNEYAEAMANSEYYGKKDRAVAETHRDNADEILRKWGSDIEKGSFRVVYYDAAAGKPREVRASEASRVADALVAIDKEHFRYGLETGGSVIDNMWTAKNLGQGAQCGISGELKGTFKSANPKTKLDNYIGVDIWESPLDYRYWEEKPDMLISRVKKAILSVIDGGFAKDGRVEISDVYNALTVAPFGFLPCNLSAFVLGFALREYAAPDSPYSCSDELKSSGPMTRDSLKEMIEGAIKNQQNPNARYHKRYIVKLTPNEKSFDDASSKVFAIPVDQCVNFERTRSCIRNQMKKQPFPLWSLKYALPSVTTKCDKGLVGQLIDLYLDVVNDRDSQEATSHDRANQIGKLCLENPDLTSDLAAISTSPERYIEGIRAYAAEFDEGALIALAKEIDDGGQYVNVLRDKFKATDGANWLWDQETANDLFRETILEYRVVAASNKANIGAKSFAECKDAWLDSCRYFRVAYEAAENHLDVCKDLLKAVYEMAKNHTMPPAQKFLDLLSTNAEAYKTFGTPDSQLALFKKVNHFQLVDTYSFADDDIENLYRTFPVDCWAMGKSQYVNLVRSKCEEYNKSSVAAKLRNLWREKTGTESPRDWSADHRMPILCLIDDDPRAARAAFDAVNKAAGKKPLDTAAAQSAIDYLEKASFYDALRNSTACDEAFRGKIIRDYDTLLKDIEAVKRYLYKKLGEPYDWFDLRDRVDADLREMAQHEYDRSGCDVAVEKIDSMSADAVKRYLKELIRKDLDVGMKIIKGN